MPPKYVKLAGSYSKGSIESSVAGCEQVSLDDSVAERNQVGCVNCNLREDGRNVVYGTNARVCSMLDLGE